MCAGALPTARRLRVGRQKPGLQASIYALPGELLGETKLSASAEAFWQSAALSASIPGYLR